MRFVLPVLLLSLVIVPSASAQIITTVAGGGPHNLPAVESNLYRPLGVAVDSAGSFFIASQGQHRVFKVDTLGTLTVVAGTGIEGYGGDGGPARDATLAAPSDVAVDAYGNVYISDTKNHRIRMVDRDGTIDTIAGTGESGYNGDGIPAATAQLWNPWGLALDTTGILYIADMSNNRVRAVTKVTTEWVIDTVAGNGDFGTYVDGVRATEAFLTRPLQVSVGPLGNLFVGELGNGRIFKVDTEGFIHTYAQIASANGLCNDVDGNLYVASFSGHKVFRIDPFGVVEVVAGVGQSGFSGDGGPAIEAKLYAPAGVALDSIGRLFIADYYNGRLRRVATGLIDTVAGNGTSFYSGDGHPGVDASLSSFTGVAADLTGNIYIADRANQRIRKLDPTGTITTVAGNGGRGFNQDHDGGPAVDATLDVPSDVALDPEGNIYIADQGNHRIRRVDADGIISTYAGDGSIDGIVSPQALALDGDGNLYVAETYRYRVRMVTPGGDVVPVAGTGIRGYEGDGGLATEALLGGPFGVAVDTLGNLYIADTYNHVVRRVSTNGIITTVVGNGEQDYSGDGGPAVEASLSLPMSVAFDLGGNLLVTDLGNMRIRIVSSDGTISTLAGNGAYGFQGDDGPAADASLNHPAEAVATAAGNVWIADQANYRLRKVTFPPEQLVDNLMDILGNLDLPSGMENSLMANLETALKKLSEASPNDDAAMGCLNAFIDHVLAQRGKTIDEAEADALIAAAMTIMEQLGT